MAAIDVAGEVATDFTTIGEVEIGGAVVAGLMVEVHNYANGQALTDFRLRVKTDYYGDYVAFVGGSDFDSLANPSVPFCSTTGPHELASGSSAIVNIKLGFAMYEFDFQAKVASGTTWVRVNGDTH